jgi:hypothetical protein
MYNKPEVVQLGNSIHMIQQCPESTKVGCKPDLDPILLNRPTARTKQTNSS